jgi:hypothetical protein
VEHLYCYHRLQSLVGDDVVCRSFFVDCYLYFSDNLVMCTLIIITCYSYHVGVHVMCNCDLLDVNMFHLLEKWILLYESLLGAGEN